MSQGSNSPFRFLFWGLLLVVVLSFLGPWLMRFGRHVFWSGPGPHWFMFPTLDRSLLMILPLLFTAIYVAVAGTLVYRDAERRGMDPWLWAAIAVFVPALIGVVIYLVVRSTWGRKCPKCGRALQAEFRICPYCGYRQEVHCPQCQAPVAPDWKLCPHCGQQLQVEAGGHGEGQPEGQRRVQS